MKYMVGIDVGTTGTKAMIFDTNGTLTGSGYVEYTVNYPRQGWAEQDVEMVVNSTFRVCKLAIENAGVAPQDILAIGFSTQRSTFCLLDKDNKPIGGIFYSWQDGRSASVMQEMQSIIPPDVYHRMSGMPHNPFDSLPKIYWIKKNMPEVFSKAKTIALMQDYIIYRFGAPEIVTEQCIANCSDLSNPYKKEWNWEMADAFGIDKSMLSPMVEISSVLGGVSGDVAQKTGFVEGTPLVVGTGDQQCAAVGAGVIDEGHASLTLGTSGFLVVGTKSPDVSKTPGVMLANNAGNADLYELECLQMGAASGYRWLRDTLCRAEIQEARRTGRDAFDLMGESVRATPPGSNGVLFLPFLQASGYPRWIGDVRASFVGLKMTNTRADMIRSVMEGISLECKDMYQALTAAGIPINTVTLTGGASKSPEWRQIIADMFNCPARQLEVPDATVVAAAIFCGVGAGVFRNTYEGVQKMVRYKETIQPIPENVERYGKIYGVYCELVQNASLFNSMAAL